MQKSLEEEGVSPTLVRKALREDPAALLNVLQEEVEDLGDTLGAAAAEEYLGMFLDELVRVSPSREISDDIEVDDFLITEQKGAKGKIKEVRKRINGGTVKELLRKLRTSIPVTKFVALDDNVREYLLYTAILAHGRLNKQLTVPDYLKTRTLTQAEYRDYGRELAGRTAGQFILATHSATQARPRAGELLSVDLRPR